MNEDAITTSAPDVEGAAAAALLDIVPQLTPLEPAVRRQVVGALATLFGGGPEHHVPRREEPVPDAPQYDVLGDLLNAAGNPSTAPEKALLAGYWLQVCQGQDRFKTSSANTELIGAGYRLSNVSDAFVRLERRKTPLVIQAGRLGRGKRARKMLKLSPEGIRAVEAMLARANR